MNRFKHLRYTLALILILTACNDDENGMDNNAPNNWDAEFPNVAVSADSTLTLRADRTYMLADSSDSVRFLVVKNGVDITDQSSIYLYDAETKQSTPVEQACRTFTQSGTYTFWASYGTSMTSPTETPLYVTALHTIPALAPDTHPDQFDNFAHKSLLLQATGTGCQHCPNAIMALHDFLPTEAAKDVVFMAIHSYNLGDPMNNDYAKNMVMVSGMNSYPSIGFDFEREHKRSGINYSAFLSFLKSSATTCAVKTANTGIRVSSELTDSTSISVHVSVKTAAESLYRISVCMVQDDIFFPQTGTRDTTYWVHNAALMQIAPANAMGAALNHGKLCAADTEYEYCCELNTANLIDGDIADARLVVYVVAGNKIVDNAVTCNIGEQYPYIYQ